MRINLSERLVEFDAAVAVDCHQPQTPDVYLEVLCCTPDTREHEALVVTRARPSTVHAALLAIGATPGAPGSWRAADGKAVPVPPRGTGVRVTFLLDTPGGRTQEIDPATWVVQKGTGQALREVDPDTGWVFAGSRIRRFRGQDVYDADGTGQLIGLHTFGSETLAWTRVESPDATLQEPLWLANNALMPPIGTPVTVRLAVLGGEPIPGTPTRSAPTLND
ncbi:MAG: YdjY domain-containing protein [Planctomycetota bacterium]|nr:YdjY domain-containing protein [Planctomycetota bacterium]